MKRFLILSIVVLMAMGGMAVMMAQPGRPQGQVQLLAAPNQPEGFARAEKVGPLSFPADFGPHDDYQTEWWYYTGNLDSADGRHFGYQLTFFRRAIAPPSQRFERASAWATDQVYMAHFALTDVASKQHMAFERFARGAAGLAGAQAMPYNVWLEDWSAQGAAGGILHLSAAQDDLALDLVLTDVKGPILQGDQGYSRKGPEPGNASYYYSQTRLETSGTVHVADSNFQVSGLSWMDHEYSTSALAADQVGWDWFALQLSDGSELMVFQIRRADGGVDPFSSGAFIEADGSTVHLAREDFELEPGGEWRSPRSGAAYPTQWQVNVPGLALTLQVEPYLADQELNVSYAYWEGAVRVSGTRDSRVINGSGYLEMTGYSGSMAGQF